MPVRPLSPELAEVARSELGEDPKRLEEGIQHLKDWIAKQPHLRARTDDQWLASFLRGCKYSLERSKEKIDLFYSMRSTAPSLYALKHTDPKFMEILDKGGLLLLPKTPSPSGPRVLLMRMGCYDPNKYGLMDLMGVSRVLNFISLVEDDHFVVAGGVHIMDASNITMAHLSQLTPTKMKMMSVLGQDASPVRMKGAHHVNTPAFFEKVFNVFKTFLNEKFKSRVYVHKNPEDIYSHIPKEILPTEYGGNGGSIQEISDHCKQMVLKYSSWLEEDEKYGTDEAKRPGKPKTAEDMFGVEGSFRQLEVD